VFKIKSLCAVVALSAAPLVAAEELSETGDFLDGVAAIVNDGIVLKSQYYETLDLITKQAKTEGWPLPPEDILQQQVLERVILIQIQMQRADMIGLEVSDQMLNQVIAGIAQQRDISFEDLPRMLAADGINYQDFRRQMRQDVTLEQLRRIDVIQRIRVSTREIQNCIADIEDNVVLNSFVVTRIGIFRTDRRHCGYCTRHLRTRVGRRRFPRTRRALFARSNRAPGWCPGLVER
jgi:peptidyl-prolyl cis-trans isomerase SurA